MVLPLGSSSTGTPASRDRRSRHHRGAPAGGPVAPRLSAAAADVYAQRPAGDLRAPSRSSAPQGELPARPAGQLSGRADRRVAERGSRTARAAVPLCSPQTAGRPAWGSVRPVRRGLIEDRYHRVTGPGGGLGLLPGTLVAICYLGQMRSIDARLSR